MKRILLIVLLGYITIFCGISACKKIDNRGYRVFTIKENKHRSTTTYNTTKSNYITFKAIFDTTSIYYTDNADNQYDVNKLYGVSDCGCNHKHYSMRLGWRWLNDSLEVLWFKHMHGTFTFEKIRTIDLNQSYDYSITLEDSVYIVCVGGVCMTTKRSCKGTYRHYYLYPYFGGDEKAPHDIIIKIR
tara:strand:- start:1065 stop:1625 length:561 start_codon:yes stop_codon:yes gene_type:complete